MQLTDILNHTGGLQSIARELGIDETQAASAANALGPAVLGGFQKTAENHPQGLDGLGGLLSQLGGGGLLDSVLSSHPTDTAPGNDVLGQIFGSKDVSRTVAQDAAAKSGLSPSILKKMLPILAMLVAGYMAKQHGGSTPSQTPASGDGGLLGGILGGLLGGGAGNAGGAAQGGGGIGSMLDMNGDGNALDDILKMAGKAMG